MQDDYREFALKACKTSISHHIMKIHSDTFDLSSLRSPSLAREVPAKEEIKEKDLQKAEIEAQIAPNSKKSFKRKIFSREKEEKDPDRLPWILSDLTNDAKSYAGSRQEAQSSTYALFVFSQDGFKVIPVDKRYKFIPRMKRQKLTTEEAEEKIGTFMHKPADRWMMRSQKETKPDGAQDKKKKGKKKDTEELDYEEEFADDEEVDFGIEDRDEAREASKRQYGRAGKHALLGEDESDFEDEDKEVTRMEKSLTKALTKIEKNDMYDGLFEESNPYISDVEEDEYSQSSIKQERFDLSDFVVKKRSADTQMGEAEAALKKLKSSSNSNPMDVLIKQESSESTTKPLTVAQDTGSLGDEGSDKKRRKIEPIAPPPPSASQVIARELEKHKKTSKSKKAAASPSNQGTPAYSPSNSPVNSPSPTPSSEEGLLMEEDVVKLLKSSTQAFTVKEIVAHFKSNLLQNAKNKGQIRDIMRKVLNHDKSTEMTTLETPKPTVNTDISHTMVEVSANNKSFEWDNVGFTVQVKDGKKKVDKVLLSGNTAAVLGGQVIGIMGGSGAGKSTLLNCLSGRLGSGKIEGNITFNGAPRDKVLWRSQCAFVEQDDLMFSNLSVSETLRFSAMLRLPYKMSNEEKFKKIDNIIMELGLDGCRNVRIGSVESKGISGGERKRVSIAMELVTGPDVLFLDEPTSGLDAFTAINLIKTLKKFAVMHKTIVIMTIHQPRTDILECLDKILLLSMGKTVWYGKTENALTHFEKLGFQIPANTNPSDFFSDITTLDQRTPELKEESTKRINMFQKAWEEKIMRSPLSSKTDLSATNFQSSGKEAWPSPMYYEIYTLLKRAMLDVIRDKAILGATLGQGIFLTIVLGFIFYRLPTDSYSGIQDRLGVTFFICVNQTFGTVMPTVNVFPDQKIIIKRERAAGTYRSFSGFFSKFISTLPLVYAGSLLLSIPIYWMIGFQNMISKYLIFILIILVQSHTANALGIAIGSFVPSARVGQVIAPLVVVIFLIFGGQFVNLEKAPASLKWIQYLSFISYSNKALAQNEFYGMKFTYPCPGNATAICETSGEDVITNLVSLDKPSMWYCVLINVALSLGFTIIGAIGFDKTTAPLMRLSSDPLSKASKLKETKKEINSF